MTLAKAIEAARDGLEVSQLWLANCIPVTEVKGKKPLPVIVKALATLPDKPMTEDEIAKIIDRALQTAYDHDLVESDQIIRALKAHNVLFVEDK